MAPELLLLLACAAPDPRPSILLISLDTVRADHVGPATPNLQAFARDALVFDAAWAQSNFTLLSHASAFTGRYPSELARVSSAATLGPGVDTLAGLLSIYGYTTAAFTGGGMLDACRGMDRGFATFDSAGCEATGTLWRSAPAAVAWLADHPEPSFVFVHGYDAHEPYVKPAPFGLAFADPGWSGAVTVGALMRSHAVFGSMLMPDERHEMRLQARVRPGDSRAPAPTGGATLAEADRQHLANLYTGGVAYADAWVGWLLAHVDLAHTVVIVMSDHGETLGEDGRFGHAHSLRDEVLRVPLMVHVPGGSPGHVARDVELIDLFPTVLGIAGVQPPVGSAGRSLLTEDPTPRTLYAEGDTALTSVRVAGERLVFSGVPASSPWFEAVLAGTPLDSIAFEGSSTVDPALRATLRDTMLARHHALAPTPGTTERLAPEVVEAMRRKGYWGAR